MNQWIMNMLVPVFGLLVLNKSIDPGLVVV